ncbi:MAG: metallophosphoesterase [Elainellaceae cyanobacterium]
MNRYSNGRLILLGMLALVALGYLFLVLNLVFRELMAPPPQLLTDPFLQLPTPDSVNVVWFTEFPGTRHFVRYGEDLSQSVEADTRRLSRAREDQNSRVGEQTEEGQVYAQPVDRLVWRHEATVPNLSPAERLPYQVASIEDSGRVVRSETFSLAPQPPPGTPLQILLTSDHQSMPLTPTNLQKVEETVGQVDAVFLAGDLVNIPDRASEWFDDNRGRAFFPSLQGRANAEVEYDGTTTIYRGGQIIQSAPLFAATGNHEVMGRFSTEASLGEQFNDPIPRAVAIERYERQASEINPDDDQAVKDAWIEDNSFNADTYHELFSMPTDSAVSPDYYAVTFGDVRLVVLYATNIWRSPNLNANTRGRYRERDADLNDPMKWGYGQHIFEAIAPGSPQFEWLRAEVQSPAFQQAKYQVVMFHHPPHSLGDNIVPAYTDPVQLIDYFPDGQIKAVRYEYPKEADYLMRDVVPLLEEAGVDLVFFGHSHVWNRFVSPAGMHFLESSNVGNTYGAYLRDERRAIPIGYQEEYVPLGDPNGLEPVVPTLEPLLDEDGQPIPYIANSDITAFSILDTATGTVSSYRFDIREPEAGVIKFDEFSLN